MPSIEIQWFPGHMARTRRQLQEALPLVDAVVELRDARAPQSSSNPELPRLCSAKPRLVLLNKVDLADAEATRGWVRALATAPGVVAVLAVDCRSGAGLKAFAGTVQTNLAHVVAANVAKGMRNRPLRLMVVGIPNVGKSSLINRLTKQNRAQTANKPGVTRRNQWYDLGRVGGVALEVLDTPGVLWPKFEDAAVGARLAFLGSIKETVLDTESLALQLLEWLQASYPQSLVARYGVDLHLSPDSAMEEIAKKRGLLLPGGMPDLPRASSMLLDELRSGKLGRFTLDLLS